MSLIILAAFLLAVSHALSLSPKAESGSRRAFLVKQTFGWAIIGGSSVIAVKPVNAYGEFEPGAKARKKAAQQNKSTAAASSSAPKISSSNSSPSASIQGEDLKSALGGFSYESSSNA